MKTNFVITDMFVHVAECLEEVEGVKVNWRGMWKYAQDFCNDNKLNLELKEIDYCEFCHEGGIGVTLCDVKVDGGEKLRVCEGCKESLKNACD